MLELEQTEINGQLYAFVDRQLKNAIIKGEVSTPILLAESGDEVLTTENNTEIEAVAFLCSDQQVLTEVSKIIGDVVQTLRLEFQSAIEAALATHDSSTGSHETYLMS